MKGEIKMNIKSLIYGVVTGVTLGSLTILFTTPQPGKEVQRKIKESCEQINHFMKKTKNETIELKEQISETVKNSAESIKSISKELSESVYEWKSEIEPAFTQLKNDIETLQKMLKKPQ